MTLQIAHLEPLAAILAGVLILFAPRILNDVVAAYLILVGILGLWADPLSHVATTRHH